jgi:membrane-associated phospholipid phosphatase
MSILSKFDQNLTDFIRGWPGGLRPLMSAATFLGEPLVASAMWLVGYLTALHKGQPDIGYAFLWAAVAFAVNTGLKLVLRRVRPHNLTITTLGIKSYSFPSGHAFGAIIFYGLFSYLSLKYLAQPWNVLIASLLGVLIVFIGISRVYLGAHYPSDVAAGWLLGGISLTLVVNFVL